MMRYFALVASLLVIPSVAMSQRGGRTQADRRTPLSDKSDAPTGPAIRVRDVEDMSPLKLLIDKRKDLKLTDAQLASLKDAESKLKDKNAPLLKAVDSIIHDMRVAPGGSTDADRAKMKNAQNGLISAIGDVRINYDAAAKDAVATLDAEQQTKANEMLAKQREDSEKTVRERTKPSDAGSPPGGPPAA